MSEPMTWKKAEIIRQYFGESTYAEMVGPWLKEMVRKDEAEHRARLDIQRKNKEVAGVLYYKRGMMQHEIAEKLKEPESSVRRWIKQYRKKNKIRKRDHMRLRRRNLREAKKKSSSRGKESDEPHREEDKTQDAEKRQES